MSESQVVSTYRPEQEVNETHRSTVRKLTLYSVLPPQGLLSQLEAGFIASPSDRTTLLSLWQKANTAYGTTKPDRSFSTQADTRAPNNVSAGVAQEVLDRARSYPPFDSHTTTIQAVRISKLVTPQITINLARAEQRATVSSPMSDSELFPVMFESAGQPEPITRQTLGMGQTNGALLFTSYDEDIRIHHPPKSRTLPINEKDLKSPSFENVCFPIGGGFPLASAWKVSVGPGLTRVILTNGIHRVYRLAKAGFEWCPLVVTDMQQMEFPDPFVELPKDMLLNSTNNPPLITDFLREDVVIPLEYFTLLKTIRLNWSFEQYVTVLK